MPTSPVEVSEEAVKLAVCQRCGEACLHNLGCGGDPDVGHTGPFRTVEFAPIEAIEDSCRKRWEEELTSQEAIEAARESIEAAGAQYRDRSGARRIWGSDIGDALRAALKATRERCEQGRLSRQVERASKQVRSWPGYPREGGSNA